MATESTEPEFKQAYDELVSALENSTVFKKHPKFRHALPIIAVPERVVQFRVVWEDDNGRVRVNRGYRLQYNSALGTCKGGLRFHPSVNLSILKFLGISQTFKNALTGLNLGGGKGGADFDPSGKSDSEIRRFCEAFMRELSKHIGVDIDCPGGDIGVSTREIGWMFGQYKRMNNSWECVLTGKGISWGGSLMRKEAAGYGVVYYIEHMIKYASHGRETLAGKKVAISGSGNVAQYAARKAIQLGGVVCSLSDSKGAILSTSENGITEDMIQAISELKARRRGLADVVETETFKNNVIYIAGARPWLHVGQVDVALPCATQNEVSGEEVEGLIKAGCRFVAEGSNMGCTKQAVDILETHRREKKEKATWYAPGKGANAGGVAISGLEMSQSSSRVSWTAEELDNRLKDIMKVCYDLGLNTAKEYTNLTDGEFPSLVAGSNIAGFVRVAKAMYDQGDWW